MRSNVRVAKAGALFIAIIVGVAVGAAAPPAPELVITKAQAKELFGDRPVRMLIQKALFKGLWLLDFSKGNLELKSLCDAEGCHEASFHPDGTRIVYSDKTTVTALQLDESGNVTDSQKIAGGGKCRWWVHPKSGEDYVIFPDGPSFNSDYPHGRTLIRKVKRGTVQPDGPIMIMLENMYLGDGRSADGKYVYGGLPACAVAEIEDPLAVENCRAKIVWNKGDACNVSMYTKIPGCFTYTDHKAILFSKPVASGVQHPANIVLPNKAAWYQWLEWATDADYHTFSENPDGKRPNGDFIAWIFQYSANKHVKVLEHGGCTHLWVGAKSAQ